MLEATLLKLYPLIVTTEPILPVLGEKLAIKGIFVNRKLGMVAVPFDVVITTLPEPPFPKIAVILEFEFTTNEAAATPPKVIDVAPIKLAPEIVTVDPVLPTAGIIELTIGEIE